MKCYKIGARRCLLGRGAAAGQTRFLSALCKLTLFAEAADGDAGLLTTHHQVRVVLRHAY